MLVFFEDRQRLFSQFGRKVNQVVFLQPLAVVGRGFAGEGLGRLALLAWGLRLGNLAFVDRPDWLAGRAV